MMTSGKLDCGEPCIFCQHSPVAEFRAESDSCFVRICPACKAIWEPETRARPLRELCDNCAFRKGSPERSDPKAWDPIEFQTLVIGQPFYCHKEMRAEFEPERGYKFTPADIDQPGLKLCAGWLAHIRARNAKEGLATLESPD